MRPQESVCTRLARKPEIVPQYLQIKKDKNPIFIWGCGDLAVQVYHYCQNYEIPVEGFFVNLPEEKTSFEGLPVYKIEQVIDRYPKFSVIVGHANYKDGAAWLQKIKNVESAYCITSCAYDIWHILSEDFLAENEDVLNAFYNELPDELSRQCFCSYFESRVNDDPSYIFPYHKKEISYYKNDVFSLGQDETLLDVGAYIGESIWSFADAVDGTYRSIIALEPDEDNCRILQKGIEDRAIQNVFVRQVCAYDREGFVKFSGEQEEGGIQENAEQYRLYPAVTLDGLCQDLNAGVSLLKINFPFAVPQILNGAKQLLREKKPKVIIRAGFDEAVLIETYQALKSLNPGYRIYLRYTVGIPQGLTIFAV